MYKRSELPPVKAGRKIVMESPGRSWSLLLNVRLIFVDKPDMVGSKCMEEFEKVPTGSTLPIGPGAAGRFGVSVDIVTVA
jgi:hypothetical protein